MRSKTAIRVASADVRSAELMGSVTLGEESAARLGLPVGSVVDLGTLAYYHRNPTLRVWRSLRRVRRNVFNTT